MMRPSTKALRPVMTVTEFFLHYSQMTTNHTPKEPAPQARQKDPAGQAGHV